MALVGTDISDRVTEILQDSAVTWTTTHLLEWINEAQRAVCLVRPDANVTTGAITLTAGSTKHSAPTGTVRIKEITRNLGADGATPGRAITLVSRQELDEFNPNWNTAAASSTIKHWIYSEDNPNIFWTYPKAHATTVVQVECVRFAVPTELAALANAITIGDQYSPAMIDWILSRAFARNTESVTLINKGAQHLSAFFGMLGAQKQAEMMVRAKLKEGSL